MRETWGRDGMTFPYFLSEYLIDGGALCIGVVGMFLLPYFVHLRFLCG